MAAEPDGRLFSPSFASNYAPIRDGLRPLLAGRSGTVLEIGSGTGQHIVHLARDFPGLDWIPSDIHPEHIASIEAWRSHLGPRNCWPAILVDASADWVDGARMRAPGPLAAVFCANVLHIAPWSVAQGLVRGAARALSPDALLILYGPFREDGRHTAPSNAAFDAALRADNPDWGVRDLDEVAALADASGFAQPQVTSLPSNNLLVAFCRLNSG